MENTSPKYRSNLPQLSSDIFLTDGGIETTLIFHDHLELPQFASFVLLSNERGCQALNNYFRTYAALAQKYEVGVILESPSWRSSSEWGAKLDYSTRALAETDSKGIQILNEIRKEYETEKTKIVISGCIGPRGDGYQPTSFMSIKEAEEYHLPQIKNFSDTSADLITAITMTYVEEAIGIVKAAKSVGMSVVISFTVETDGKLPSGKTLKEAIETVDRETENGPLYYMVNCAHTSHFRDVIMTEDSWIQRVKGIRGNASKKSHEELNECETLDEGSPVEMGQEYKELIEKVKSIVVVGGCCGTDDRHMEEIIQACIASRKK